VPEPVAAWLFAVDPREVDLAEAFDDGEAVLHFEVDPARADQLRPGQPAHLWVHDPAGAAPAGIYATGSLVGPVARHDEDGEEVAVVPVGLESLRTPIDGADLLAHPAFAGSAVAEGEPEANPVALDAGQQATIAADPLEPGPLARVVADLDSEPDGIALPALEVRLREDTFLVVEGIGHDGWTVVRGDPDMEDVTELPEQHRTFIDAVEYVATAVRKAERSLPVVDVDEGIEAVAVFDADGGVYAVVKEGPETYTFAWLDDDGTFERLDRYASLKEAILLPVLDEELFGGM
jgi:hypothetical protein